MGDENLVRGRRETGQPGKQFVGVGVRGQVFNLGNLGTDRHITSVDLDFARPVDQGAPPCSADLVSGVENGVARIRPERRTSSGR